MQSRIILFLGMKHTRLSAFYSLRKLFKLKWSIAKIKTKEMWPDLVKNKNVYESKGMPMLLAVTALLKGRYNKEDCLGALKQGPCMCSTFKAFNLVTCTYSVHQEI